MLIVIKFGGEQRNIIPERDVLQNNYTQKRFLFPDKPN